MGAERPGADTPLPLLLWKGDGVSEDDVAALRQARGVQLFDARDVRPSAAAFSLRSARATIVATIRDPAEELVYIRTSGFRGPLLLAVLPQHVRMREALLDADVLEVIALPIVADELDRALDAVRSLPPPAIAHSPLGILLDPVDRTVRRGDAVVRLSQREFALLHCLIRENRPVSVAEILDYVWGGEREPGAGREIVDVYVSQVRKKLQVIGLRDAIRTYRDFGYGLAELPPTS